MQAIWQDTVIAQSDNTVVVEGNHYFPAADVNMQYFSASATTSSCGWKGTANYYDIQVQDHHNPDAAWYYAEPKPRAAHIKGYVAFWKGITVSE